MSEPLHLPRGMSRVQAASYVGVSPSLFDAMVQDRRTVDFVVVPDRSQLSEIVRRARDGRLRTNIGNVSTLPGPKLINSRTVWDRFALDLAFEALPDRDSRNPWDGLAG